MRKALHQSLKLRKNNSLKSVEMNKLYAMKRKKIGLQRKFHLKLPILAFHNKIQKNLLQAIILKSNNQ